MIVDLARATIGRLATVLAMAATAGSARIVPVERTATEMADTFQALLDRRIRPIDWAVFIGQPICDPPLDNIRTKALLVETPLTDEGRLTIKGLLAELESIVGTRG